MIPNLGMYETGALVKELSKRSNEELEPYFEELNEIIDKLDLAIVLGRLQDGTATRVNIDEL